MNNFHVKSFCFCLPHHDLIKEYFLLFLRSLWLYSRAFHSSSFSGLFCLDFMHILGCYFFLNIRQLQELIICVCFIQFLFVLFSLNKLNTRDNFSYCNCILFMCIIPLQCVLLQILFSSLCLCVCIQEHACMLGCLIVCCMLQCIVLCWYCYVDIRFSHQN